MAKHIYAPVAVLTAAAATGWGTEINTTLFDFVLVQFVGLSSPSGTLKCYGSGSSVAPTWADPITAANIFATKFMYNLESGGGVKGDTGIVLTGAEATVCNEYKINTDFVNHINFNLEAYAAGTWSINIVGLNKQA